MAITWRNVAAANQGDAARFMGMATQNVNQGLASLNGIVEDQSKINNANAQLANLAKDKNITEEQRNGLLAMAGNNNVTGVDKLAMLKGLKEERKATLEFNRFDETKLNNKFNRDQRGKEFNNTVKRQGVQDKQWGQNHKLAKDQFGETQKQNTADNTFRTNTYNRQGKWHTADDKYKNKVFNSDTKYRDKVFNYGKQRDKVNDGHWDKNYKIDEGNLAINQGQLSMNQGTRRLDNMDKRINLDEKKVLKELARGERTLLNLVSGATDPKQRKSLEERLRLNQAQQGKLTGGKPSTAAMLKYQDKKAANEKINAALYDYNNSEDKNPETLRQTLLATGAPAEELTKLYKEATGKNWSGSRGMSAGDQKNGGYRTSTGITWTPEDNDLWKRNTSEESIKTAAKQFDVMWGKATGIEYEAAIRAAFAEARKKLSPKDANLFVQSVYSDNDNVVTANWEDDKIDMGTTFEAMRKKLDMELSPEYLESMTNESRENDQANQEAKLLAERKAEADKAKAARKADKPKSKSNSLGIKPKPTLTLKDKIGLPNKNVANSNRRLSRHKKPK